MKNIIKWMYLFAFLYNLQVEAFYMNMNEEATRAAALGSTGELKVKFDEQSNKFPQRFSVDVSALTKNEYSNVHFVKLSKNDLDYPIASSNVYTSSSNNKIEQVKATTIDDNSFEMYKQEYGNGYATLIRNDLSSDDQTNNKFRMIGTLHSKKDLNIIYDIIPISINDIKYERSQSRNIYDSKRNSHTIRKRQTDLSKFCNLDQNTNKVIVNKVNEAKFNRSKRALNGQPINLYVELLLVTDNTIYLDHQKFAQITDRNLTFQFMKIYYSHFFNGVNQHYQNSLVNDPDLRITIKLKNFIFYTTATTWTDTTKYGVPGTAVYNGRQVLQASLVLDAFRDTFNAMKLSFTYDMAVSTFNIDIWGGTTSDTASVVGLAYVSEVCGANRFTIIEDLGGFAYIPVASHEIGHNLGAYHDGATSPSGYSTCLSSNGNIMSPTATVVEQYNQYINKFSSCSINAFKLNLLKSGLSSVSTNAQCLSNVPVIDASDSTQLWNAEDQCKTIFGSNSLYCTYPGQIWSASDQCSMINGNGSFACSNQISSICTSLWCGSSSSSSCTASGGSSAAEGTTCDIGKICIQNQCVSSPVAPTNACLFADQQIKSTDFSNSQIPYSPMDCDSYLKYVYGTVKYNNGLTCSSSFIKNKCCSTCLKYQDFSCFDTYSNCGSYVSYCGNAGVTLGGLPVDQACPNTCGKCQPLTCKSSSYVCQNGGSCVNSTSTGDSFIGFTCNCKPGFYGSLCELRNGCLSNPCPVSNMCQPIGSLGNYVCKLDPNYIPPTTTTKPSTTTTKPLTTSTSPKTTTKTTTKLTTKTTTKLTTKTTKKSIIG